MRKPVASPSLNDWKDIAVASLKGRTLESLERISEDGITIKPLYTQADRPDDAFISRAAAGWQIATQIEPAETAAALNAALLEELEGGAQMIMLAADQDMAMLPDALAGVLRDAVRISVTGGDWQGAMAAVCSAWAGADQNNASHVLPGQAVADAAAIADWIRAEGASWPKIRPVTINGLNAHEEGHTDTAELAIMLAEAAHLLRVFDAAGITPEESFSRMHCCFAVGADLYGGIAKTRAAAQVFARLAEACGVAPGPILDDLHGVTSARQMTRLDADTNMLRGGTALLAMVLGGVGVATSLPHDWLTGSRMESRRLARNSHHIMAAEARLDQVIDPAAGSFYIDQLTHALASKAWQLFCQIESEGGITAATALISAWADEAAAARQQAIDHGDEMLLGVTRHPRRDEVIAPVIGSRGGARRPSAAWEDLYAAHAGRHQRVLCLDLAAERSAATAATWLQLAGVDATVMRAETQAEAIDTITAARPELIIIGAETSALSLITSAVKDSAEVHDAAIFGGDKLAVMQALLGGHPIPGGQQ